MASSINASVSGAGGLISTADNSGILNIQTAGTNAITVSASQNTTFAGTVTLPTGAVYPIVSGTSVASTSGTSISFTSIPSWVKRITVMFTNLSTNGSSFMQIQLGTSGGLTTSGYAGTSSYVGGGGGTGTSLTTGLPLATVSAGDSRAGTVVITNITGNTWTSSGVNGQPNGYAQFGGGFIALSGTLTQLAINMANGTDAFDSGTINILYE
jgi:hypothetical protein